MVTPLHVRNDAFERVLLALLLPLRGARIHDVAELDFLFARTLQHRLLDCLGQGFEGRFDVELVVFGQALQQGEVVAVAPVPALDGTAGQAQRGEGHHALRVEEFLLTQAIAAWAGTHR